MSKNQDRYKEDLSHLDTETLEELEPKKFERFHPKKQKPVKGKYSHQKQHQEEAD